MKILSPDHWSFDDWEKKLSLKHLNSIFIAAELQLMQKTRYFLQNMDDDQINKAMMKRQKLLAKAFRPDSLLWTLPDDTLEGWIKQKEPSELAELSEDKNLLEKAVANAQTPGLGR
jgi:hypothetical protein